MRVCKSCHNDMIALVNCNRPRSLKRAFSHDVTTGILVFTNNENFSLFKSANISYYLGESIWPPRQRFLSSGLKIKVGPKELLVVRA